MKRLKRRVTLVAKISKRDPSSGAEILRRANKVNPTGNNTTEGAAAESSQGWPSLLRSSGGLLKSSNLEDIVAVGL